MDAGVDGLSIKEAAARLGVSTKTVRRRILDKSLPAHKLHTVNGYVWRVDLDLPAVVPVGDGQRDMDIGAEVAALRQEVAALKAIVMSRQAALTSPVHFDREVVECAPGQGHDEVEPGGLRRLWAWLWEVRP